MRQISFTLLVLEFFFVQESEFLYTHTMLKKDTNSLASFRKQKSTSSSAVITYSNDLLTKKNYAESSDGIKESISCSSYISFPSFT